MLTCWFSWPDGHRWILTNWFAVCPWLPTNQSYCSFTLPCVKESRSELEWIGFYSHSLELGLITPSSVCSVSENGYTHQWGVYPWNVWVQLSTLHVQFRFLYKLVFECFGAKNICAIPLDALNRRITFKTSIFSLVSYSVMSDCWKQDPDERPSFQKLLETMENVILQEVDYFDFAKLDKSKDYYAVQESRSEGTGCSENTFL